MTSMSKTSGLNEKQNKIKRLDLQTRWVGCLPPQQSQSLDRHSCHDTLMGKFSASCAWSIIKLRNFSTSMEISSQNLEANEGFRVEVDPTPTKNVPNLPLRAIPCTFSASEYRRHRDLIWHSYWLACTQNATAWHSIQIEVIVCFQLYLF